MPNNYDSIPEGKRKRRITRWSERYYKQVAREIEAAANRKGQAMGRIRWNTNVDAPCCPGEIVNEDDGRTVLVQTDWDFPSVARTFGWSIQDVQVMNAHYYGVPCKHEGTDGTIDCPDCGYPASGFIREAQDWLDEHDGVTADDPGYFGG